MARSRVEPEKWWQTLSHYEAPHWAAGRLVAGVDEVGRGPLAGPVVAAAVILDPSFPVIGIRDSKALTALARARLYPEILQNAVAVGVGMVGPRTIDRINIYQASRVAMQRAIAAMEVMPHVVLSDAMALDGPYLVHSIVHGDAVSVSIGAASIVAKVIRDRYMEALDAYYPGYGFSQHKGYPTALHRKRLRELGPSPCHRRSFHWDA
ncbi:MAG: ribonuclease HII [Sulfobacillus benefaciens]|uniref:Ribonuclease HII n=1 Tax=Sulfobacillus benefaciens TaxID=453960 RepID=A0A2T2XJE6_9FIRM|nr:MAG: ribonuclease HII [Sulfobacillus benefaciens]